MGFRHRKCSSHALVRVLLLTLVASALNARTAHADEAVQEEASPAEPAAAPQPDPPELVEARERIARGTTLFDAENFEGSLSEFESALDLLAEHPMRFLVIYNIAKCLERLFRYDEAMQAYRRFLDTGGADTELAPEVRAKVEVLQGLLGTVRLSVDQAEYEVWVGDRHLGNNLETMLLPGGDHRVEIRAAGFVPAQQQASVVARREVSLRFELEELAEEYSGISPTAFWITAGVGVVAAGAGLFFGLRALSLRSEVDSRTPPIGTEEEADDIAQSALFADIFFATAGVAAATALVLALFTNWGGDDDEPNGTGDVTRLELRPFGELRTRSLGLQLGGSF